MVAYPTVVSYAILNRRGGDKQNVEANRKIQRSIAKYPYVKGLNVNL
jgi:hypothetical protein